MRVACVNLGDPIWLLLVHAGATWAMTGLIWFVQIVHYPLFSRVGEDAFAAYERWHQSRTTLVVGPLMLVELATALIILAAPPTGVPGLLAWSGAVLLIVVWVSTFAVQVPCHARLARDFAARTHRMLVATNWIRTAGWTVRGVLAAVMIARAAAA